MEKPRALTRDVRPQDGDEMYVLEDGAAVAEVAGVGVVKQYGHGDYFGEMVPRTDRDFLNVAWLCLSASGMPCVFSACVRKRSSCGLRIDFAWTLKTTGFCRRCCRRGNGRRRCGSLAARYASPPPNFLPPLASPLAPSIRTYPILHAGKVPEARGGGLRGGGEALR